MSGETGAGAGAPDAVSGETGAGAGAPDAVSGETGAEAAPPDAASGSRAPDAATESRAPDAGELIAAAEHHAQSGQRTLDSIEHERIVTAAQSDLEAYRYALWRGRVTFHDVAGSWFHMSDPQLPSSERARFREIFPGLLDAFAEPRGGIITAYFCRHIRVAAALTDIDHAARAEEGVPEVSGARPPALAGLNLTSAAPPRAAGGEPDGEPPRPAGNGAPLGVTGTAQLGEAVVTRAEGKAARGRGWLRRPAPRTREGRSANGARPAAGGKQSVLTPFRAPRASSSAIHIEPTFGDPEDWPAKEILFHCLHLHYRALEFLTPQPRKICMRLVFGVITTLLGTLDARHAPGQPAEPFPRDPAELATLERELHEARGYYERSAQRQAQLEYFVGMLVMATLGGTVFAILAANGDVIHTPLLVSLFAGAIGAVVSVMTRMTTGKLVLKPESGKWVIRCLGMFRPVIGAVFGAALYVLLAGGLISLSRPSGADAALYFAGLGFLAGFSERFAQDAIAGASNSLSLPGAAAVASEAPRAPHTPGTPPTPSPWSMPNRENGSAAAAAAPRQRRPEQAAAADPAQRGATEEP